MSEQIRELAYRIWEEQGSPDGREHEHWLEAERRMSAAAATVTPIKASKARKAVAPKTPEPAVPDAVAKTPVRRRKSAATA